MSVRADILVEGESVPLFLEDGTFTMRESLDYMVPTATLRYRDSLGVFFNYVPLVQNSKFEIYLEDENGNTRAAEFYPFNYASESDFNSDISSNVSTVDLISTHSKDLLSKGEFHSLEGKASEYVSYLADKLGFKSDIEETASERSWVNPNWKFGQMLKYLASHSKSLSGSSGYIYYVDYTGKLLFKSVDECFTANENPESLVLDLISDNVVNFKVQTNLFANTLLGNNKLDTYYFDRSKGEVVREETSYKQGLKKRAKSGAFPKDLAEDSGVRYLGDYATKIGADFSINKEVFHRTLYQSELVILTVTVLESPFSRRVGDVISVDIHSIGIEEVNLNFSGRYLIKSIITHGSTVFLQTLILIRKGINLDNRPNVE